MGGNVFKDGSTRRYSAQEYYSLLRRLELPLSKVGSKYAALKTPKDKESFGDADILIIPNQEWSVHLLSAVFETTLDHVSRNGDVWSLVFEEIQVDLMTTNGEEFDAHYDYKNFSDFGNLRGKIIHKFGLKFGHDGLIFPVRSENHVIGNIVLSRDPTKINSVFDFEMTDSVDTLEEMFDIVMASKFFNPAVFAWDAMNAVARIRDKKRATYHAFLGYLETHKKESVYIFHANKLDYLPFIFENFPDAKTGFDALWAKKEKYDEFKKRFNGDLVSDWTGFKEKELGELMKLLKNHISSDNVYYMTDNGIKAITLSVANKMSQL